MGSQEVAVGRMSPRISRGITSTRYGSDVDHFYTLAVAGPEYVPRCAQGATLTFRVDGKAMPQTAVNDLAQGAQGHELNFTIE